MKSPHDGGLGATKATFFFFRTHVAKRLDRHPSGFTVSSLHSHFSSSAGFSKFIIARLERPCKSFYDIIVVEHRINLPGVGEEAADLVEHAFGIGLPDVRKPGDRPVRDGP